MSDFKVDSMGRCFVCLTPLATHTSIPIKLEPGHIGSDCASSGSTTHSLQRLSRYQDMDLRKMFTDEQSIPPLLMTMVEKSKLKADLCGDCVHLVQQFSRLHQQMERIVMEMTSFLGLIREKFYEEVKTDRTGKDNSSRELVEKMNILNALRKEAITKCSLKLLSTQPRVKLENLATEKALTGQLQSNGLSFTSVKHQENILPNSNYDNPIIDMGIIKVETHLQDSVNSVSDSETVSNISKHSRSSRKNNYPSHECVLCGKEFGSQIYLKRHHSRMHTGSNFRCEKCSKTFKRNDYLTYHQRQVKDCVARRVIELSRESKFPCKLCNNRFADARKLTRHFRSIHMKLKEHGCSLCRMKFARKDALQVHMRRIHNSKL